MLVNRRWYQLDIPIIMKYVNKKTRAGETPPSPDMALQKWPAPANKILTTGVGMSSSFLCISGIRIHDT